VRKGNDDPVQSMKETAQNLALQAKQLREHARDLSQESLRVRRASKKAREARADKRGRKKRS
jgi:hypothetical protein